MRAIRRVLRMAFLAMLMVSLAASGQSPNSAQASEPAVLKRVEVSRENDRTIVRVGGEGALEVHTERLANPERLVLNFSNALLRFATPSFVTANASNFPAPVLRIRAAQFKADIARVVIDLDGATPFTIETTAEGVAVIFGAPGPSATPNGDAPLNEKPAQPDRSQPRISRLPAFASQESSAGNSASASGAAADVTAALAPVNSFSNGLLTFSVKNQPLAAVLSEVGDISGLPIVVTEGVGVERISAEFRGYRLDEALRQMLKDYDVLFSYGGERNSDGSAPLRTVWVYARNGGPGMNRFALAAWTASGKQYQQMLSAPGPDERAHAVDALIRRQGREALGTVLNALQDPSDKVRYQALYRAVLVGALPSEDTMIELVLHDESPSVRTWAFQTLPLDPTLRWVALRAASDSNQQISEIARQYLSELDADAGPAAPQTAQQTTTSPER